MSEQTAKNVSDFLGVEVKHIETTHEFLVGTIEAYKFKANGKTYGVELQGNVYGILYRLYFGFFPWKINCIQGKAKINWTSGRIEFEERESLLTRMVVEAHK